MMSKSKNILRDQNLKSTLGQTGLAEFANSKVAILLANKTRDRFSRTAIIPFGKAEMWDTNKQSDVGEASDISNLDSRATGSFY